MTYTCITDAVTCVNVTVWYFDWSHSCLEIHFWREM